jgi:hypothetical protein
MDMKPITRLSVTSQNADPLKAAAALVLTRDPIKFAAPGSLGLIETQLRRAIAVVTDTVFLATLTSGVSPNTSTGSTAEAVRAGATISCAVQIPQVYIPSHDLRYGRPRVLQLASLARGRQAAGVDRTASVRALQST